MVLIGNILHHVSSFSGLAVDSDDIAVVSSAHIVRIDWQIRNCPSARICFFSPFHTLGNGILMRAGECSKDQFAAVRLTRIHVHASIFFVLFYDFRHIGKVQTRVDTVSKHVHRNGDDVHVAGTLAVAEESALDSVAAC